MLARGGAACDFAEAVDRRQALCDLCADGHHDRGAVGGGRAQRAQSCRAHRRIRIRQCRQPGTSSGSTAWSIADRGNRAASGWRRYRATAAELRRRSVKVNDADRRGDRRMAESACATATRPAFSRIRRAHFRLRRISCPSSRASPPNPGRKPRANGPTRTNRRQDRDALSKDLETLGQHYADRAQRIYTVLDERHRLDRAAG